MCAHLIVNTFLSKIVLFPWQKTSLVWWYQNMVKKGFDICHKCFSESQRHTNNFVSKVWSCHQLFVDWHVCIMCATIKQHPYFARFLWVVHTIMWQVPTSTLFVFIFPFFCIATTKYDFINFMYSWKIFLSLLNRFFIPSSHSSASFLLGFLDEEESDNDHWSKLCSPLLFFNLVF